MKSQREIFDTMNKKGYSVVCCGDCSHTILIDWEDVDGTDPKHTCPYCGYCGEPCDFPDLILEKEEVTFKNKITDINGDVWTPVCECMSGSYYWETDYLPKDVMVYCTPFYDGCDGIPLSIVTESGDVDNTLFNVKYDCVIETEMSNILGQVKNKLNK